jgi:hypothetical protein
MIWNFGNDERVVGFLCPVRAMRRGTFLRAGTARGRFLSSGAIRAVSFAVLATPLRLLPDLHLVTPLKQRQKSP